MKNPAGITMSVVGAAVWPVPKASSDKREFVVGLGRRRSPAIATRLGASEPRPVVKDGDRFAVSPAPPRKRAALRFPGQAKTGLPLASARAIGAVVEASNLLFEK